MTVHRTRKGRTKAFKYNYADDAAESLDAATNKCCADVARDSSKAGCRAAAVSLYKAIKKGKNQFGSLWAQKAILLFAMIGWIPGDCAAFATPDGQGVKNFLEHFYPG